MNNRIKEKKEEWIGKKKNEQMGEKMIGKRPDNSIQDPLFGAGIA